MYDEYIVHLELAHKKIDILNAQLATDMTIKVAKNMGIYEYKIYNYIANLIIHFDVVPNGLVKFQSA